MLVPRRCVNCNNRATKFLGMIVLHPDTIAELDRIEGYYCDDCYARRMYTYALGLGGQYVKEEDPESTIIESGTLGCPYCSHRFNTWEGLQSHRDASHSDVDGHVEIVDPAKKAEEVLAEDSKRWAAEYLTAPTDTPIWKARELKEEFEKQSKATKDKDRVWQVFEEGKNLSDEEKHERIRELAKEIGIERLRKANPPWADFVEKDEKVREEWAKNKPPKIPAEKMKGLGPDAREALKTAQGADKPARVPYTDEEGRELYVNRSGRFGRIEKEERDFKCNECPAAFNSRYGLANHRKAHARDREREQKRQKRQAKK